MKLSETRRGEASLGEGKAMRGNGKRGRREDRKEQKRQVWNGKWNEARRGEVIRREKRK